MDDPKEILTDLRRIFDCMSSERATELQSSAIYHNEGKDALFRFRVATADWNSGYIDEKLSHLETQMQALAGFKHGNGHPRAQQARWGRGDLNTLQNVVEQYLRRERDSAS
jgi:hypothetical protein